MKKGEKRISLLLALIMMLSSMPIPVFADDSSKAYTVEDSSGTVIYETANKGDFMTAWDKVKENGGTLILHTDGESTGKLEVESKKSVTIVMNGHTIKRNLTKATDAGEVILVKPNTTLNIVNTTGGAVITTKGAITGGWSTSGGGGIHVQENSTLKLQGVTIKENKTTHDNGGGGVRLQGKNTVLEMDASSSISNNTAKKGGGISMMGEGAQVIGGRNTASDTAATVSYNQATHTDGGGIYVGAKSCSISGLNIIGNTTDHDSYGGGIYMASGCGCEVTDCTIKENKAYHGGGIYVDGNGGSLSYSIVTGNKANIEGGSGNGCGGGIYVDDGDTLHLSGKLSVYGNTAKNDASANLYLDTKKEDFITGAIYTYSYAYISGEPSGTMVPNQYVHIGWDANVRGLYVAICDEKGVYDTDYLRSDVKNSDGEEMKLYWSWGTNDHYNDRRIRSSEFMQAPALPEMESVPVSQRYTMDPTGYQMGERTYPLQKGVYTYRTSSGVDSEATYFYSDGYFAEDPKNYNDHLATMSLVLTTATFNATGTDFDTNHTYNGGYSNRFRNAKQLLSDLGFQDENIHVSDTFLKKPTDFSIGVIMGAKEMSLTDANGDPYILLPIAVRGAGYEGEWVSNVTLGKSGEAAGFSNAADQVMENLEIFLAQHPELQQALEEGRVKFWVTGFSRSAATANLTAKRLTDQYGENNKIFSYCFEPPKGGVDSEVVEEDYTYDGQYLNIHNIVNACDIVPYVGPAEMGFKRYGVDHYVPGKDNGNVVESSRTAKINKGADSISVTTYSDNQILPMDLYSGSADSDLYLKRRAAVINQLRLLDETIVYDDYFSLATMNYVGDQIGTSSMIGELENGCDSFAHEWIPVFFKNLQEWACNNTWDNNTEKNKYGGDYRGFYSGNTSYMGETHVTVEEALQVAVSLVFGLNDDTKSQLMDSMMYRLMKLDLKSIYLNVIIYWYEKSYEEQRGIVSDVWDQMEKNMTNNGEQVPKLSDILTEEEFNELKRVFPTLFSFLCQFINYDWWEEPNPSLEGVDTEQIHVGTLAYNASALLMNHYPSVVMAWLRTYDSHYMVEESDAFVSADPEDDWINKKVVLTEIPEAPKPEIQITGVSEGGIYLDSYTVSITTSITDGEITNGPEGKENGSAIYYRIRGGRTTDWTLYEGPFEVYGIDGAEEFFGVEAYAIRFQDKSESSSEYRQIRCGMPYEITINNNLTDEPEWILHAKAGQVFTVTKEENRMVYDWEFPEGWNQVSGSDQLMEGGNYILAEGDYVLLNNKSTAIYAAKATDAAITIHYYDECGSLDLSGITPVADEPLATSLDSGATPYGDRLESTIQWSASGSEVEEGHSAQAGVAYEAVVTVKNKSDLDATNQRHVAFLNNLVAQYGDSAYGVVNVDSNNPQQVTITCVFPPVDAPPVSPEETHQVTVNCYDINLGKDVTTWEGMPEEFRSAYSQGERVTVPAPVFENMQFVDWTVSGAALSGNTTDTVAVFTMADGDVTITANYKPIVREINLTIDGLELGRTFPKTASEAEATINYTYPLDPSGLTVTWNTEDETIRPGKNYTATVSVSALRLADGTALDLEHVIFDTSTKLTVNGQTAAIVKAGNTYMGIWTFTSETAPNPVITEIVVPQNQYLKRSEMGSVSGRLPENIQVTMDTTSSGITHVNVDWRLTGAYDPNLPDAQSVVALGTLEIPDNVDLATGLAGSIDKDPQTDGIQIKIVFHTDAAERVATPVANPGSGTYDVEPFVQLTVETEGADIYYTLDGTTPTVNSTKYTGGFEMGLEKTLKAIAVKDGLFDSYVASYIYTAEQPSENGTTGPGGSGGSGESGGSNSSSGSSGSGKEEVPAEEPDVEENIASLESFTDLDTNLWYTDGIRYCVQRGIMSGVGNNTFSPNGTTTRSMVVTMLWNLEKKPIVNFALDSKDVEEEKWYTEAVRWATSEGIVEGYGNGLFGTSDDITREQLLTIMWKYAKYKGYDVSLGEDTNILSYGDSDQVSEWAIPAVQWACAVGIIKGIEKDGVLHLDPQGKATRAQMAVIIQQFCEFVMK